MQAGHLYVCDGVCGRLMNYTNLQNWTVLFSSVHSSPTAMSNEQRPMTNGFVTVVKIHVKFAHLQAHRYRLLTQYVLTLSPLKTETEMLLQHLEKNSQTHSQVSRKHDANHLTERVTCRPFLTPSFLGSNTLPTVESLFLLVAAYHLRPPAPSPLCIRQPVESPVSHISSMRLLLPLARWASCPFLQCPGKYVQEWSKVRVLSHRSWYQ